METGCIEFKFGDFVHPQSDLTMDSFGFATTVVSSAPTVSLSSSVIIETDSDELMPDDD